MSDLVRNLYCWFSHGKALYFELFCVLGKLEHSAPYILNVTSFGQTSSFTCTSI